MADEVRKLESERTRQQELEHAATQQTKADLRGIVDPAIKEFVRAAKQLGVRPTNKFSVFGPIQRRGWSINIGFYRADGSEYGQGWFWTVAVFPNGSWYFSESATGYRSKHAERLKPPLWPITADDVHGVLTRQLETLYERQQRRY